jgi:hypothetical protein
MKRIPLTKGQYALVDDRDFEWLSEWRWCAGFYPSYANGGNYLASRARQKSEGPGPRKILMARAIMEHHGLDPGERTDHINRDPLDNRIENLRGGDARQNAENLTNQSQHGCGVSYYSDPRRKLHPYRVWTRLDGKKHYIGCFATPEEAQQARTTFLSTLKKGAS